MTYYGVKEGRSPGVYRSWGETQAQTSGFPNAKFKKFNTEKEARAFVDGNERVLQKHIKDLKEGEVIAYVDGSFCDKNNVYGYGVVLIDHNGKETYYKGYDNNKEFLKSRNVSGEVMGAVYAMYYAMELNYKHIYLHHDYQGIASWATKEWSAGTPIALYYKQYHDNIVNLGIKVDFVKVRAHSGDYYNEMADKLAKEGTQLA